MAEEIIATGRRKCAIAVVKLVKGKGRVFVNGKTLANYIGNQPSLEMNIFRPLVLTENQEKYDIKAKVIGGKLIERNDETLELQYFDLKDVPPMFCKQHQDVMNDIIAGKEYVYR